MVAALRCFGWTGGFLACFTVAELGVGAAYSPRSLHPSSPELYRECGRLGTESRGSRGQVESELINLGFFSLFFFFFLICFERRVPVFLLRCFWMEVGVGGSQEGRGRFDDWTVGGE